jgi:DNA adenine methylase
LNSNNIQILSTDYDDILKKLDKLSLVYLAPPYHPLSESSKFTGDVQGGWNIFDQVRLREACDDLTQRGIKFLLSNSASSFIKDQYREYNITTVKAMRSINADAEKRGEVDEVLIRNYE